MVKSTYYFKSLNTIQMLFGFILYACRENIKSFINKFGTFDFQGFNRPYEYSTVWNGVIAYQSNLFKPTKTCFLCLFICCNMFYKAFDIETIQL